MNRLHSKSFTVTQFLARYFISMDIGERISTVSEFLEEIDVARGTIQNGLQILKDSKAILLSSRGKLGTFLESKNTNILLQFADIQFIIGVMPLPYTKLYEGLSSGIIEEMTHRMHIPLNMAYMRGAQKRIDLVCDGRYDFAVISKFAALEYQKHHPGTIDIAVNFGKQSYLKGHKLVLKDPAKNQIENNMKVAIDYDSIDQTKLTLEACKGKHIELIPMSYSQFATRLLSGAVDAIIWNADEISRILPSFKAVDIQVQTEENTVAVIVVDSRRTEVFKLIQEGISLDVVLKTQQEIVDGIRTPQY